MAGETPRRLSLPLRTLAAALAMGAAGSALARAVTVLLANISAPSLEHSVLPAKFTYGIPTGWTGQVSWAWAVGIVGVLLFPLLFNPTWFSRRVFSAAGIVKFVTAAILLVLVASAALIGGDFFTSRPWGGGANLPLSAHVVLLVLAGLCGGALFALFGDGMAGGAPDRWIQPGVARADAMRAFASGLVAAVVVSLLAFVVIDAFNLFIRALSGFLGESAEVSPLGWSRLALGLTLGLGLLLASCGSLLVAASPDRVSRARRALSLAVAAVPAVTLLALVIWFQNFCRTRGETDRTLAQAAGLEAAPAPRLMILPGPAGPRVYPYPMVVSPPGWDEEVVGATRRNIELAERYLRRLEGRWTAHTVGAWHLAASVHDRLLEPEAALRARTDAAEATGSLLSTAMVLAKIPNMPRSAAAHDVSARLLDPAHFTNNGVARSRLQRDSTAPRDRVVSGAVELPGDQREGVRVALYRQRSGNPPSDVPSAMLLIAAVAPDARGRFVFEGLAPSFYSVGVLLPERFGADTGRVAVTGALRVVDLSKDRRADAGTIRVLSN